MAMASGESVRLATNGNVGAYSSMSSFFDLRTFISRPAIAYYDESDGDLGYLTSTEINGTTVWTGRVLDAEGNVGKYASLMTRECWEWPNPCSVVGVSYFDESNGDLKYIQYTSTYNGTSAWSAPVKPDTNGVVGLYSSLVFFQDGAFVKPAICYYNETETALMFTKSSDNDGLSWSPAVSVAGEGLSGSFCSMAVAETRYPVLGISYYDESNGDLMYVGDCVGNGTAWDIPVCVDSAGDVGRYTSMAFVNGCPAIAYYNATDGDLIYVRASNVYGSAWGTPVCVASEGDVGKYCSLKVVDHNLAISCFDESNGDLLYIYATDGFGSPTPGNGTSGSWANGTSWSAPIRLDEEGVVGKYSCLGYAGLDEFKPVVSYYDETAGDLKLTDTYTIHYVDRHSTNPVAPFASWSEAASNIQDAVDVALYNGVVLVTNGVFDFGGKPYQEQNGGVTNRLVMACGVTVRSVNGPDVTVIEGQGPQGPGAVRCVAAYGGLLDGFTLRNGYTDADVRTSDNAGGGFSGLSDDVVLTNCRIMNCWAVYGGGVERGRLFNCLVSGNAAYLMGGGVDYCEGYNSVIRDNSVMHGFGGGVFGSSLDNSAIFGNEAFMGGGVYDSELTHCTVQGNKAVWGGGVVGGTASVCIVYHNIGTMWDPNYSQQAAMRYCCTTPDPGGVGNITNDPLFVSSTHLSPNSPCIGQGLSLYSSGADFDGERWLDPPSMGCDEVVPGAVTGLLHAGIFPPSTSVVVDCELPLRAEIEGRCNGHRWLFGDGSSATDSVYTSHAWSNPGDYPVVLRAYNETYPEGLAATLTIHVVSLSESAKYVDRNSPIPGFPFNSWEIAAHTLQEAVDAQNVYGGMVWVTNGVYDLGGRVLPGTLLTNRLVVTNNVRMQSVNGSSVTTIRGGGTVGPDAIRCIFLTDGILDGFTLSSGCTCLESGDSILYDNAGGGVNSRGGVVSNCLIENCSAVYGGGACFTTLDRCLFQNNTALYGGGAEGCKLRNGVMYENSATGSGGGATESDLYNCTIVGNMAVTSGGGVAWSYLYDSIVYYNTAPTGSNYVDSEFLNSCTAPDSGGEGMIVTEPLFVDYNETDLHLQMGSPCIDSGAAQEIIRLDYDGVPRPLDGDDNGASIADVGAYEYIHPLADSDQDGLRDTNEFFLGTSAVTADSDDDRVKDGDEVFAGTDPLDSGSLFEVTKTQHQPGAGFMVRWSSVAGKEYSLYRSATLMTPVFTHISSNIFASPPENVYTDEVDVSGTRFYKIEVEP